MPVTYTTPRTRNDLADYVLGMQGVHTGGYANTLAFEEKKRKEASARLDHKKLVEAYEARRPKKDREYGAYTVPVDRPRSELGYVLIGLFWAVLYGFGALILLSYACFAIELFLS